MIFLDFLMVVISGLLAIPVAVLAAEVFAASVRGLHPANLAVAARGNVAVLVPAHNEAETIRETLESVLPQLRADDQLVVVADNCTDDTAPLARGSGATVIERQEPHLRGKGYALDYGVRFLERRQPAVVIVVDADCRVHPGCIDRLAFQAETTQRPAQALYLMSTPSPKSLRQQVAEFAWLVKNLIRPLGLANLGFSCQLMGTGMAFPWALIHKAELASANLVEDLKLGLDLALAGFPPALCPEAEVTSRFPDSAEAASGQRRRWEHGHLALVLSLGPRLLWSGILKKDPQLMGMTLDLCVPPLALLSLLFVVTIPGLFLAAFFGASSIPLMVATMAALLFVTTISVAWLRFARQVLPLTALLAIPLYVVSKIPLYLGFAYKRQREWVKTDRS